MNPGRPLRVAIFNDYELVVRGVARMLEPYRDRVVVVEIAAGTAPQEPADIALYDSYAHIGILGDRIQHVLQATRSDRVVVYSWSLARDLVSPALAHGASGYLGKALRAADLVTALERISTGEVVVSDPGCEGEPEDGGWPGRCQGLTLRESEIVALITQGLSNQEIADRAFLSINSVKSYIRSGYRKMGVTSRSRAVLWGLQHGFLPGEVRASAPLEHDEP